ncbi:hypothetical protein T552_00606 [Pneumocystis carinii B80]|uniref:Uncharacterized protein n=1 Tax=Pneumocystis carinii (strain B80) TaxID=1408658 RepID=A0A0W4ZP38_PNEC8|nr:hypothetical protein T552_00606 [Pneumocystis carinii B80]KTW30128.1 hypothetical protein T552_00606 [Pneumocystis carinii B80]
MDYFSAYINKKLPKITARRGIFSKEFNRNMSSRGTETVPVQEHSYERKTSHVCITLFWRMYARPFGKVFLLASITYLSLHYLWWHLYSEEKKREKKECLFQLEKKLHEMALNSKSKPV